MEIVLVFGLSGAGKTTLIKDHIQRHPEWTHLQAGNLIKEALKDVPKDQLRIKDEKTIIRNQSLMVDAFWRRIKSENTQKVVFDGHPIIDNGQKIIKIPTNVIASLQPSKIIFIEVNEKTILKRRSTDTSRDRPTISANTLAEHQLIALEQIRKYNSSLNIPIVVIKNPKKNELTKHLTF